MESTVSISESEWEVMMLVWSTSPVAAADLIDQLNRKRGWAARTTRTLLERLVAKGALTYEQDGKRYLYRPAVTMADCVRRESRSFLDRVFGGKPGAMLVHLVKETPLTADEIADLRRLLKQKEKEKE
ncbi:MAG: BlaI/MecI/CopY family transcriptional regulator [Verrucomicrobiales bacterium]|nr:BlaI/MecI/CopY family transcriptional regulator [Verrucomicrobiales bacterium]